MADYNSQPIWHSPSAVRVVYSDASDTGFGGYVVEHGACVAYGQWTKHEAQQSSTWRELSAVLRVLMASTPSKICTYDNGFGGYVVEHGACVAYGQWTKHEAQQSSTWRERELSAVLRVLMAVATKLKHFRVRWFTDNQNVARILLVGSKKTLLQALAVKVFSLSVQNHIKLEPEWIPRDLNERADALSRIIDYDDWMLNPVVFADIEGLPEFCLEAMAIAAN